MCNVLFFDCLLLFKTDRNPLLYNIGLKKTNL